jgi:GxxExxY protein
MSNTARDIKTLCDLVRETAYAIHVYHGHGHLEKVYENALAHRLRKAGIEVQQQSAIQVYDEDGALVGDYFADLIVDGWLIVELKATRALAPEHEAQILGYLAGSRLEHGLLINFGSYKFQIRKFIRTERGRGAAGVFSSMISALFAFLAANSVS